MMMMKDQQGSIWMMESTYYDTLEVYDDQLLLKISYGYQEYHHCFYCHLKMTMAVVVNRRRLMVQ